VSLAIVFGLVQWSVLQLLFGVSPEMAARTSEAAPRLVGTAVAVGALIGWLVPTMHRTRKFSAKAQTRTASAVP